MVRRGARAARQNGYVTDVAHPRSSSEARSVDDHDPTRAITAANPGAPAGRRDGDATDDHAKEACGVFAVYGPGLPVAQLTYLGLFALQHRGQEAAGMAVSDCANITVVKDQGLVASVFDERTLAGLSGDLAIGHCRYSTTGSSTWRNAQPSYRSVGDDEFALGHNGNLTNTATLADEAGMLEGTVTSDTDLIAELLAAALARGMLPTTPATPAPGPHGSPASPAKGANGASANGNGTGATVGGAAYARPLERALLATLPLLQGAFSLVLMDEDSIVGIRDPQGFRPLCLGRLHGGWVLASETPALDIVGAELVRELEPGEMVVIDAHGVRSFHPFPPERVDPKLCLFEFVYFARPDSRLYGRSVHQARIAMGEELAEQAPAAADMVIGVPESGVPAAEGFARRSGITLGQGLVKNRYIGRSFIAPNQSLRAQAVRMKLNPLRENIAGKRLVVVDDSIVRGTTQRQLVKMLRESGVVEVHLRITSPPVKWSCFYGIDTGDRNELIAQNLTIEQIREYLDVDSLAYLHLDRLVAATGAAGAGFCDACFTGDYPVEVPVQVGKHVLEGAAR
jgi:amidophosphoribosyltransferase